MGIFGSLIGGGVSALAGIGSSMSTKKQLNKIQKNIEQEQQDNEDWYNRRYNELGTERADAQAALAQTRETILQNNKAAAGAQAVGGGTEESVAATKQANANALAQTESNIVQNAEQRKDAIENTYNETKRNLTDDENNLLMQKAQNTAAAFQGVQQAAQAAGKESPW